MYSGYREAYQRSGSHVLVTDHPIQGFTLQSPVVYSAYGYQPVQGSSGVQMLQVQNQYQDQKAEYCKPYRATETGFGQAHATEVNLINSGYDQNHHQYFEDNPDDFKMIEFQDSFSQYPFFTRVAYVMLYSRVQYLTDTSQQSVNILMTVGADGKYGLPGGHIERSDRSVLDGLNRELREEINAKKSFQVTQNDYVLTLVQHKQQLIEHIYAREVSASEYEEMEKRAPSSPHWGKEVYGIVRVPLMIAKDGFSGFPAFLSNVFSRNFRSILTTLIQLRQLMPSHVLREAILLSDNYMKRDKV